VGTRRTRLVLLAADGLVALAAIGGGAAMLTGLDKFPTAWLEGTPFSSYVIPGLLLALFVGGSAAVATATLLVARNWSGQATIVAGAVLMGWLVGEVLILKQPSAPSPTEVFFFAIGLIMLALGLNVAWTQRQRQIRSGATNG
jgi:hypothetical protein